jgi:hypothetical protein
MPAVGADVTQLGWKSRIIFEAVMMGRWPQPDPLVCDAQPMQRRIATMSHANQICNIDLLLSPAARKREFGGAI